MLAAWVAACVVQRTNRSDEPELEPTALEKLEKPKEVATRLVARESATAFLELLGVFI